jgi:hypothetical protein
LKSRIKQIIRESSSLKKEYKRVKRSRRARKNWVLVWIYRLTVTCFLSLLVWKEQEATGHMTPALAAFSLYLTFVVLFRMQRVWVRGFTFLDH